MGYIGSGRLLQSLLPWSDPEQAHSPLTPQDRDKSHPRRGLPDLVPIQNTRAVLGHAHTSN
jgi:hypothetical protein